MAEVQIETTCKQAWGKSIFEASQQKLIESRKRKQVSLMVSYLDVPRRMNAQQNQVKWYTKHSAETGGNDSESAHANKCGKLAKHHAESQ